MGGLIIIGVIYKRWCVFFLGVVFRVDRARVRAVGNGVVLGVRVF